MPPYIKNAVKNVFDVFYDRYCEAPVPIKQVLTQARRERIQEAQAAVNRETKRFINELLKRKNTESEIQKKFPTHLHTINEAGFRKKIEEEPTRYAEELGEGLIKGWGINPELIRNGNVALREFCSNNKELYAAYLKSIASQKYFVFTEEIPILATVCNIIVHLWRQEREDYSIQYIQHIFEPETDTMNVNSCLDRVNIYHQGIHYSRANTPFLEPHFEEFGSVIFQLNSQRVKQPSSSVMQQGIFSNTTSQLPKHGQSEDEEEIEIEMEEADDTMQVEEIGASKGL